MTRATSGAHAVGRREWGSLRCCRTTLERRVCRGGGEAQGKAFLATLAGPRGGVEHYVYTFRLDRRSATSKGHPALRQQVAHRGENRCAASVSRRMWILRRCSSWRTFWRPTVSRATRWPGRSGRGNEAARLMRWTTFGLVRLRAAFHGRRLLETPRDRSRTVGKGTKRWAGGRRESGRPEILDGGAGSVRLRSRRRQSNRSDRTRWNGVDAAMFEARRLTAPHNRGPWNAVRRASRSSPTGRAARADQMGA